jgi:adenine deaminase
MPATVLRGQIVDIPDHRIYPGEVIIEDGIITAIHPLAEAPAQYILPGFIDAHVHIESSMLVPSEFARLAVVHGTVATVSDPHEIANVCGMEGVRFMIDNGKQVPFKFVFGAPSCVPATAFETAGATLDAAAVTALLQDPAIYYLSEMMNFPGVLHKDPEVMAKIAAAHGVNKPVDGHAPGLRGQDAANYIAAGISTDHECFTYEEGLEKLKLGMQILIREGSAARNFDALIQLLNDYPDHIMFCSDDKHPDSLLEGHINQLAARAVAAGVDVFKVLKAACINPALHYKIPCGMLQPGHHADCVVVNNLTEFKVLQTYINGQLVAENGQSLIHSVPCGTPNQFNCSLRSVRDFIVPAKDHATVRVIEALDGQLITRQLEAQAIISDGHLVADVPNDILKIAVVNRYHDAPVAVAFVKGFGLHRGAIASTVAHDSHNIIVCGTCENDMTEAVNALIDCQGGVAVCDGHQTHTLALPVAGLMSNHDGYQVAAEYTRLDQMAKALGATLQSPFMTLSFMALLVIPSLKLSDKGLFNGDTFTFTSLQA